MHPLLHALSDLGGVARASSIARTAADRRSLERAAERGQLVRLRRGVYGLPGLAPEVAEAARAGGRVAGVSALRHWGLWEPPGPAGAREVEVRRGVRVPDPSSGGRPVIVRRTLRSSPPEFGFAPLEEVLRAAAERLPMPFAVAVLDSALRSTPVTPVELTFAAAAWPDRAAAAAALADERSESGTESVLRVLLLQAGIRASPQAPLPVSDLDRADLLVGDRLLIECDSEDHHGSPAQRLRDLRRDESLVALGFLVLRLDYVQVLHDPAGVVATVLAIVERGDHLSRTRTRRR